MPITTNTNRLLLEQLAVGPRTFAQLRQYFERAYPITPDTIQGALKRHKKAKNLIVAYRRRYRRSGDSIGYAEYSITDRGRAVLLAERLLAGDSVVVTCDCCGKVVRVG